MTPSALSPPPKQSPNSNRELGNVEERAGKYLIFRLGSEEFGARVLQVREIMGLQDVTPVPHTPAFVQGVINLRGKVIPVVDLRLRLGLSPEPSTTHTCIIVVNTQMCGSSGGDGNGGKNDELMIGLVVDEVVEVLPLADSDIEDTPDFGPGVKTTYLLGIAKVRGKVKILLDLDLVLNRHDLDGLNSLME